MWCEKFLTRIAKPFTSTVFSYNGYNCYNRLWAHTAPPLKVRCAIIYIERAAELARTVKRAAQDHYNT